MTHHNKPAARRSDSAAIRRTRTLHPAGKNGVSIPTDKYDVMRRALLRVIPRGRCVAYRDLTQLVRPLLSPAVYTPRDSVSWYLIVVKQDLEARGLIEQAPGLRPQHLRRASAKSRENKKKPSGEVAGERAGGLAGGKLKAGRRVKQRSGKSL